MGFELAEGPRKSVHLFIGTLSRYIPEMTRLWKNSKSSVLTLVITAVAGACVLAFAYHLRHYSEILSGVIGGLTIILGMVTAEWLRSTSEASEETWLHLRNLSVNFSSVIFNPEFLLTDPSSIEYRDQWKTMMEVFADLTHLTIKTRWPQPNAKDVRRRSLEVVGALNAMVGDAFQNEHLWSVEKRYQLLQEADALFFAFDAVSKKEEKIFLNAHAKWRETERREGMGMQWMKQAERERKSKSKE